MCESSFHCFDFYNFAGHEENLIFFVKISKTDGAETEIGKMGDLFPIIEGPAKIREGKKVNCLL